MQLCKIVYFNLILYFTLRSITCAVDFMSYLMLHLSVTPNTSIGLSDERVTFCIGESLKSQSLRCSLNLEPGSRVSVE